MIDEVLGMLSEVNPEEVQQAGLELARQVKTVSIFVQPASGRIGMDVWENCAKVLAERPDQELEPILDRLFGWLRDTTLPGAITIAKRLHAFGRNDKFNDRLRIAKLIARSDHADEWLRDMERWVEKGDFSDIEDCPIHDPIRLPKNREPEASVHEHQPEITIREERLTAEEYIDFLKRTDLGSQYPKERFAERIARLVQTVSVSLVARDERGLPVGVLFGLTDYAYWLYVTDLGVDRAYTHQGIGRRLLQTAHRLAGGEKDIAVYLIANEDAVPFYEKCGLKRADDVMKYNHIEWTEFTVR